MITLTTPSAVYWLLNTVQLIGALGIVFGLLMLAGVLDARRAAKARNARIKQMQVQISVNTQQMVAAMARFGESLKAVGDAANENARRIRPVKPKRTERGAGSLERLLVWTLMVGGCLFGWAVVIATVVR